MKYAKILAALIMLSLAGCSNQSKVIEPVDNRADLPSTVTRKDQASSLESGKESVTHFAHEEKSGQTDPDRQLVLSNPQDQPFGLDVAAVTEDQIYFMVTGASISEDSGLLQVTLQISNLSPYSYQVDSDDFAVTDGTELYPALDDSLPDAGTLQNLTDQVVTPSSSLCGNLYFAIPNPDLSAVELEVLSQGNVLARFLLE